MALKLSLVRRTVSKTVPSSRTNEKQTYDGKIGYTQLKTAKEHSPKVLKVPRTRKCVVLKTEPVDDGVRIEKKERKKRERS